MGKSFSQELAEWMAKVDKQLSNLSSGNRLDHASLDGTTLYLRDDTGNLSGRLGRQPDGSNGVHVVKVQPPPQLTAAILTVGEQAGTCLVEWDGNTAPPHRRMPLIHGHTEIWAELVGEDWSPTVAPGEPAKRVGTIRDRTGGEVVVALPQAGTWAVWLRAMGADRETAGPWSPVATVEIVGKFNEADFEERLLAFANGELLDDAAYNNLMARLGEFLVIRAGSLASNDIEAMRIVSSLIEATTYLIHNADGDVSVRLDGVANYLAGTLHAGMANNAGISLDYGEKVRFSGLNEEGEPDPQRVISTPYLNFHTANVTYQENQEPSIHLDRESLSGRDGMMIINPGYTVGTDAFRGKLNVVGDVQGNRVEARERATAGQGFEVPHSDSNLVTRLYRESWSDNTYLLGRHHGASQSRARDSFWASSQYELDPGRLRRRIFTWGAPPPTGWRVPVVSVHLTPAANTRGAYVIANTSNLSNTGYTIAEHNPSSARATYFTHQLAIWGQ